MLCAHCFANYLFFLLQALSGKACSGIDLGRAGFWLGEYAQPHAGALGFWV
jgi:hypothetical protein